MPASLIEGWDYRRRSRQMFRAVAKQPISLPVGDKICLFDNIADSSLLLYARDAEIHNTIFSFLRSGLERGELCFFAYNSSSGRLHLEQIFGEDISSGALRLFPFVKMSTRKIGQLNDELRTICGEIPESYGRLRLVVDFGHLPNSQVTDETIDCVREIARKREEKIRLNGSGREVHFPLRAVVAFGIEALSDDNIKELRGLCKNLLISARDEHGVSFLNFKQKSAGPTHLETVSREVLEHLVKSHLKALVLDILLQTPMCGYDVIKTIYHRYHTFLSQGTVYPLLYSLQRNGLLEVSLLEKSRAKIYSLTADGEELTRKEIGDFKRAQGIILGLMS